MIWQSFYTRCPPDTTLLLGLGVEDVLATCDLQPSCHCVIVRFTTKQTLQIFHVYSMFSRINVVEIVTMEVIKSLRLKPEVPNFTTLHLTPKKKTL